MRSSILPETPAAVRRYRRALAVGLASSVLLHGLVFLAWRTGAPGGGSGARDRSAAEEPRVRRAWRDEALEAVTLSARREREIRVPSPPAPVSPAPAQVDAPAVETTGRLVGVELGRRDFERPGAGASGERASAEGPGGSVSPPVPRSVLPEWNPPSDVRGQRVTVRVYVDTTGLPAGPVELRPPTSSADFNRRLREKVRRMEFAPARAGGRVVAAWAELTFVF